MWFWFNTSTYIDWKQTRLVQIDVIQKHHNNTDYLHMESYLMELVLTLHGIK